MSCSWQQTRAARALEHELSVLGIDFTEDGDVVFHVDGLSDVYTVQTHLPCAVGTGAPAGGRRGPVLRADADRAHRAPRICPRRRPKGRQRRERRLLLPRRVE